MPDTGSAPNKTFSRSDGTRTGAEVWQEAKAAPVKIRADDHDAHDQDIADALNARLMNNGGNQPSADIPWNDKKITGLGAPTARTDAMRLDKVQDGAVIYGGTAGGTGDALTVTLSPAITAYATGMLIAFKASATNTGAATLNANSVGAKSIKKGSAGATALAAGDITSGGIYICHYDGTNLQLLNPGSLNVSISAFMATVLDDASASAARTTLGVAIGSDVQAFDADTLKADTADTLTAGYNATEFDAGTKSSGTFTPDPASGNFQKAVNGGAHTLAPPSTTCSIVVQYTNNASAGAITTSGFTKVSGTFTTTNGHDFMCYIVRNNGFSHLNIVALQ